MWAQKELEMVWVYPQVEILSVDIRALGEDDQTWDATKFWENGFPGKGPPFCKKHSECRLKCGLSTDSRHNDTQTQLYYLTPYTGGSVDMQPVR